MEIFWLILIIGCLAWYSTITVYVAFKGIYDIRDMLANLKKDHEQNAVHK